MSKIVPIKVKRTDSDEIDGLQLLKLYCEIDDLKWGTYFHSFRVGLIKSLYISMRDAVEEVENEQN